MTFAATYLREPDLFPARIAGEPWGPQSLVVDFAGGPYVFHGLDEAQADALRRRYAPFSRPTGARVEATVRCDAFRLAPEELRPADLRGVELTFDRDYAPAAVRMAGHDLLARLEWRSEVLSAGFWTSTPAPASFHGALENVFRALVAYRALALGGALLHSAGVLVDGSPPLGVVACGPSGAGKSTLSRLAQRHGLGLASDDLNMVLPAERGAVLAPVPFAGDREPGGWPERPLPLAAVCRLAQGTDERLEPLPRAVAAASLAACSPTVNADPFRADRLLANLDRLVHSTPAYRLTFALDGGAADLLRRATR